MQTDGGKWQQKIVIIKSQSLSVSAAVRVLTETKKKEGERPRRGEEGRNDTPQKDLGMELCSSGVSTIPKLQRFDVSQAKGPGPRPRPRPRRKA